MVTPAFLNPINFITNQSIGIKDSLYTLVDFHWSWDTQYAQVTEKKNKLYELCKQDKSLLQNRIVYGAQYLRIFTHSCVVAEIARAMSRRWCEHTNPLRVCLHNHSFSSSIRTGSILCMGLIIAKIILRRSYQFSVVQAIQSKQEADEVD